MLIQMKSHELVGWPLRVFVLVTCVASTSGTMSSQAPTLSHADAHRRAQELVARMNLDEKISQLHGIHDAEHYRMVPALPRLGIPEFKVTNGPAGAGPGGAGSQQPATALPAPIALAASWDADLARLYGRVAGEETRSLGYTLLESPDVNIARVPQGGRVFESYGEDPFLAARMAVANIEGIQSTGVIANVKHFVANNQETNRGTINEIIFERALREIYLPAFEASVKEAHVASLMCAYPRVNGLFNCENKPLLHDILRDDWGFDGFVTSDFGAVHSSAASALAGLDLELPTGIYFGDDLRKAVHSGLVPVSRIDEMLVLRYAKLIELGWFGPQPPSMPIDASKDGAISRKIATESMVLLKNDGHILPLKRNDIKKVALIGPYAVRQMTGGGGSSHVIPLYSIAPVDGLDAALLLQTKIVLLDGNDLKAAVAAAKAADVAILMVGDDEGEDHDHPIALPAWQNQLIAAVAAVNPKTVVVLKSGSAVLMPWVDQVPAILEAWYPGEEDGHAVADVLLGKVNPSGKLPLSFPRSDSDTLAANPVEFPGENETVHYSEGLKVGYRAFAANGVKPLFEFGFGLSYTEFTFDDLHVSSAQSGRGAHVTFRVTNAGTVDGAEVAQVYVSFPPIEEGNEPSRQLKGFAKLQIKAHESKLVDLDLDERAFSYWSDRTHTWKIPAGKFQIEAGDSSVALPLKASIQR
jgi:beta-glucosidase